MYREDSTPILVVNLPYLYVCNLSQQLYSEPIIMSF